MGSETGLKEEEKATPDYLAQLLRDKRHIQPFCTAFMHLERILDEEIDRVRQLLIQSTKNTSPLELPEESGPTIVLSEKLYVPAAEHPEFNFVGRILGPRGMTAKQLERDTGCRIMVRGRGSTRDKKREDGYKGKSNWEHLNDDLHVLITVEDTRNRAMLRLQRAVEEVKKLLVPAPEGEDDLKKLQLMELAIINGTYRDNKQCLSQNGLSLATPPVHSLGGSPTFIIPPPHLIRTSGPAGPPFILAPRLPFFTPGSPILTPPALPNGAFPSGLLSPPPDTPGGIIFHVDFAQGVVPTPLFDYAMATSQPSAIQHSPQHHPLTPQPHHQQHHLQQHHHQQQHLYHNGLDQSQISVSGVSFVR